jgi:hypothetical protein
LIQLCNRLLKQHLESGLGDAAITQEDVDAVMKEDSESHLAQDILAGTLRLTEKTLRGVIHSGENQWVEFKSTLFTDIRDPKQKKDSDWSPDEAVMREIGAFANSKGGIIVLGVSDEGLPYSLNADLARFKKEKGAPDKQAEDGFRNALSGVIEKHISPLPSDLQISFFSFSGSRVCVIQIPAALYPIYVKKINHHFFIRQDNRVKEMDVYEAVVYMDSHYGEVCPVCRRPKLDGLDRSIKRD